MVCRTLYSPFGSNTSPTRTGFSKTTLRVLDTPNLFCPACNNTVIPNTKIIATVRIFNARISFLRLESAIKGSFPAYGEGKCAAVCLLTHDCDPQHSAVFRLRLLYK